MAELSDRLKFNNCSRDWTLLESYETDSLESAPLPDMPGNIRGARLTLQQRTAYALLLSKLQQAEGIAPGVIAQSLRDAAVGLFDQLIATPGLSIIQSAVYIREWMQTATGLISSILPANHKDVEVFRGQLSHLLEHPSMKTTLAFVSD